MITSVFNTLSSFLCTKKKFKKIQKKHLDWENINFPREEQDYQQFEMSNKSIALNIICTENQGELSHYYKSEFNKTREKK